MEKGEQNSESRSGLGWLEKEADTYPDDDRTGGRSQNHSPHYHFPHYAETDPLMDHTQGSNQVSDKPEECGTRDKLVGGWVGRKHTGAQHTQNTQDSCAKAVTSGVTPVRGSKF